MNKNLYVGNLSPNVTEEDLRYNFAEVGKVISAVVIKDKFTGMSKGFGFVEMETEEGAREAMTRFHGGQLDGSSITVNEARPKKEDSHMRRDHLGSRGFRSSRPGGAGGRRY